MDDLYKSWILDVTFAPESYAVFPYEEETDSFVLGLTLITDMETIFRDYKPRGAYHGHGQEALGKFLRDNPEIEKRLKGEKL